jgi:xylose dehydrogenase (NAD/NADP)
MSQANKLRWGILGVAKINERLIPGFRKATLADLCAIASRDLERARAAATQANVPTAHGSYEALLADPNVDAIYVPLPNHLHDEWTRKAADAGKHVLCEKPLTPNADSARALVAHCRSKGVQLMDGFMWPHHPRTAMIRQRIEKGDVGRVVSVRGAFTFRLEPDPTNIRLQPSAAGGSLLDVGCYPVYGIRWAFGEEPVRAWATAKVGHGVDLETNGVVWMADGRVGSFDCGFTSPFRRWLEIVGTEAVIRVPMMWIPEPEASFTIERDGAEPEVVRVPGYDQVGCMIDDFSRAVLEGTPVRPDAGEAVKTLRVLDALATSARQGGAVEV